MPSPFNIIFGETSGSKVAVLNVLPFAIAADNALPNTECHVRPVPYDACPYGKGRAVGDREL